MNEVIQEALMKGVEMHVAGEFAFASQLYDAVIKLQPNHADANHNMGLLKLDTGHVLEALPYLQTALQADTSIAQFWLSYIKALIKLDRVDEATRVLSLAKESGAEGEEFLELHQKLKTTATQTPPQSTINQLLNLYEQRQLEAVVEQAQALTHQYPKAFGLWNIIGAANKGLGQVVEASEAFKKVTELNPSYVDGFSNLGVTLHRQGKLDEALEAYKKALLIKPDSAEIQCYIGNSLKNQGKLEKAVEAYKSAIELKYDYTDAHNNLGIALKDQEKLDDAIEAYKKALSVDPKYVYAHYNLGKVFQTQGKLEKAIEAYKMALSLKPDYADVHNNMGAALKDQFKLEEAIQAYNNAISLKPDYAEAYSNMGAALNDQGKLEEAIEAYKMALSLRPDYAEAYYNMGNTLKDQGKLEEANAVYKRALNLKPNYAEAYQNIGVTLKDQGKLEEAIEAYKMALALRPNYAEAYYNMGNALKDQGKLKEAIEVYKSVLEVKPDFAEAHAQKLFLQAHLCDWNAIYQDGNSILELGTLKKDIQPFTVLALEDAPDRHRFRSELYASTKFPKRNLQPPARPVEKSDRLRIGYFSADFKEHPVAYLMAKVFEIHDRNLFEVFGYSIGLPKMDEMRKRLTSSFDIFRDLHNIGDAEVVKTVREEELDIAIDLTGYTQNTRSGLFSHRLAPVQINYLGYPGTLGAEFMDYIIADQILIPQDYQKFYSEKPIYLPHQYQAQDDSLVVSKKLLSREKLGLPEQGFVFCAINNNYKISPREFDIWMNLLHQVEESVLWLLEGNKWARQNLENEAKARGINSDRIIFTKKVPFDIYLSQFRQADLYLDTFNYNAGSTASNALWAGLPLITMPGKSYSARMASSLLHALEMPELIANSEKEYGELALGLAKNRKKLNAVRKKLSRNIKTAPLFQTERFTRNFEKGLRAAYSNYFEGKAPEVIFVQDNE